MVTLPSDARKPSLPGLCCPPLPITHFDVSKPSREEGLGQSGVDRVPHPSMKRQGVLSVFIQLRIKREQEQLLGSVLPSAPLPHPCHQHQRQQMQCPSPAAPGAKSGDDPGTACHLMALEQPPGLPQPMATPAPLLKLLH